MRACDYYRNRLSDRDLPAAFVDLDVLARNADAVAERAGGLPVSIASKSIRCPAVMERLLDRDAFSGVMCYHGREAAFLAAAGFEDLLVAYPVCDRTEIEAVCEAVAAGTAITLMVDSAAHVERAATVAAAAVTEWRNWAGGASCRPRPRAGVGGTVPRDRRRPAAVDALASRRRLRPLAPASRPDRRRAGVAENYTGIVDVDADQRRATVRAGTTLGDLTDELAAHGLSMENLGDIDAQTVAGALSTGTHGTGIDLGVLSPQVAGLRLVTADGEIVELGPEDGDAFRAAQVSLGALGVISTVTLDLVPAYDLRFHARPMPLGECLADLERLRSENRHFEFFRFPHTDTAFVKTMNRTDDPHTGHGGDSDSRLENLAWEAMCRLSTAVPATTPAMSTLAAWTFSEERSVAPSHEQFAHDRAVRFEESEWSVPADDGAAVVRAIRSWIEESGEDVCFPVEFRYVAGDDIPLSPAYGRDSAFVAVHKYHPNPTERISRRWRPSVAATRGGHTGGNATTATPLLSPLATPSGTGSRQSDASSTRRDCF